MSLHPRSKKRLVWAYLGLSSGLHAAGLLVLPALLGLGWWRWHSAPKGGPREVHVAFSAKVVKPVEVTEVPLEEVAVPELEIPEWPEQDPSEVWEKDVPSAEPEFETVPMDSIPIEGPVVLPSPEPKHVTSKIEPTQAAEPGVEPTPVPEPTSEVPPGQAIDDWEPKPWLEFCPAPSYPTLAQQRKWQGTALLRLHVGPDGMVRRVELLESCGHDLLDQAALKALASWRFHPAPKGASERSVERRVQFRLP